jgi:ribosomal protein S18 acetylase RimI-like enzyme
MSLAGDLESPKLPKGFILRHVEDGDAEQRAHVHQMAFNPSRVSVESYKNVMATWPYRADLDWIVEAPNGEFAAFALAWFDDVNSVGELEPVGTASEYRELGLARAVSLAALHALKNVGAESAVVYPRGDADYPVPNRLYEGLGFVQHTQTVTYSHPMSAPTSSL